MKSGTVKDTVFIYLVRYPETRDDDLLLLSKIWQTYQNDNIDQFYVDLENGYLPHFETIRRIRQLLQEKIPELRGKKYKQRQQKAKNFGNFSVFAIK